MTEMKQIYNFAVKWYDKFLNQSTNYLELVESELGNDCKALGFKMDCGRSFFEKYGQASSDYEVLKEIIDDITDIFLLGSAIYSQWRYFNHWSYSGVEILSPKNRLWFIIAFNRMVVLTKTN